MVELPGKEDRYPHQLSGGEKQRVALARALVLEPAVLLLDEPLGALDQKLRQQMQVELKRLHARLGITFIFVTHDQEEALVMSDRVAVINHGRLEQVGASEEIYEHPRTHFVADFMGVENFFEVSCAAHTPEGTRFEMEGGQALWAANSADLPQHSLATLAVRPECVRLTHYPPAENGGPLNLLEGELVESIYEGGRRRWAVRVSSGQRVVVRDSSASREPLPISEAKVYVSWDAARSLVIRAANGAARRSQRHGAVSIGKSGEIGRGMEANPDPGAIPGDTPRRHRVRLHRPILGFSRRGSFPLRLLRGRALSFPKEIRIRHGLAELLGPGGEPEHPTENRHELRHEAHGSAVRPVRRAPGARV